MQPSVVSIRVDAEAAQAERALAECGHDAIPVVDTGGGLVGIVAPGDLLEPDIDPTSPVSRVATNDVVANGVHESVYTALTGMVEEDVDHLPVVEGRRLVAMCTRTDILQARIRELDHERVEAGWLSPALERRR